MDIYSHAVLVTVTSECCETRVICKTSTGTWSNSADPDQIPQNAETEQAWHCLLKLQGQGLNETVLSPHPEPSLHSDNRLINALSALIIVTNVSLLSGQLDDNILILRKKKILLTFHANCLLMRQCV